MLHFDFGILIWPSSAELFEQIRRDYDFGIGTIVGMAKKLSVHRRMVHEAIGSALPKPRKEPEHPRWKLKAAVEFYRFDSGSRPESTAEPAAHRAPDLGADAE